MDALANVLMELSLIGPARLSYQGRTVKLRRKGLAILYYLAFQGSTRREALAELLWGHALAARNLRVELHMVRAALYDLGFRIFSDNEDPLSLPPFIELGISSSGIGELMQGLDDISPDFQDWLEATRHQTGVRAASPPLRETLVDEVARQLRASSLLILKGQPGSGRRGFAQALARRLKLPYVEGSSGSMRALRFISLPVVEEADVLKRIASDADSVWVLACSSFGEDPRILLALRSALAAERVRFLHLPPISWPEARAKLLSSLPVEKAAAHYLASSGNQAYLEEIMTLVARLGASAQLPVPQRVRAAFQVEARHLSLEARLALERLSVHPGPLSPGLLSAMEVEAHIDELERQGWLVFDRQWRFGDALWRFLLYESLQGGRRQRYHQMAARHFAFEDNRIAEMYHQLAMGESIRKDPAEHLSGWQQLVAGATLEYAEVMPLLVAPSEELELLDILPFGEGAGLEETRYILHRSSLKESASGFEWVLPEGASLLRLRGHAVVDNIMGVGMSGQAFPLKLELLDSLLPPVLLAEARQPAFASDHSLVLPLASSFDYWLCLPTRGRLRISSAAERGLIVFDLSVHELASVQPRGQAVRAYPFAVPASLEETGAYFGAQYRDLSK